MEEYQKRMGEAEKAVPSGKRSEKQLEDPMQREEKLASIWKDVPDFGTDGKRRIEQ